MTKDIITEEIKKHKINWIQIHFTDIAGRLRVVHVPADRFVKEDLFSKGINFDGSSVGFRTVEKSDMVAIPDEKTFQILPYEDDEAVMHADLFDAERNMYRAGPRNILKKALTAAQKAGFDQVLFSPEMEFCCFQQDETQLPRWQESVGYFTPSPLDDVKAYRKQLSNVLMQSGYKVKYHHHEKGKYQHEIEVTALDVLNAADFCTYFKFVARDIAELFNLDITFMPKPLSEEAGSGMHAHIALYKRQKNLFLDESQPYRLSQTALYFIGGILNHARGIAALGNPTLNSYKRLIPHFEAPIYIAWDQYNRSSLIRIPAKKNVDIEVRNADPAANPYLFFSAIIYAGLDGIKKKTTFEPVQRNIYKMDEAEIKKLGIKRLPTNLMEALEELKKDSVLINGIGKDAAELFIAHKTMEWHRYMGEITDLDYRFYFHS